MSAAMRRAAMREWGLLVLAAAATLALALGALCWYAPRLLGLPADLQKVQVARELPPFFEGVFRDADHRSREFLLPDPYLDRARPLYPDANGMGPTDLLGFRNRAVPNVADVVAVGDSQTYGINAVLEQSWPARLAGKVGGGEAVVYSMAVGGWGAAEYLEVFDKALRFRPRVVVVAFYTGNDALDTVREAYAGERWPALRVDPALDPAELPRVAYPPPPAERVPAGFAGGIATVFTPHLRLAANEDGPAVRAGYRAMAVAARLMTELAREAGARPIFTIIPSKELVYARRVAAEGLDLGGDYAALVAAEAANLRPLAASLRELHGADYAGLLRPLQAAALGPTPLYPPTISGHPSPAGYEVIAATLAAAVARRLPAPPDGLVAVPFQGDVHQVYLVRDRRLWTVQRRELLERNGWGPNAIRVVSPRAVANLPYAGTIDRVDPDRFGPRRQTPAAS